MILKTAVGSDKVMRDFDSELIPVKGPSAGNDSGSKDCVNLPLPTAVFRMMWVERLKKEISSFSSQERFFVLLAMLCGFFISSEYAITRPVSCSLFLTAYGSSCLPYVWLSAVPLNFLLVALYNKFLPRLGCLKMFAIIAGSVVLVNGFSSFCFSYFTWLPFFFYLWKEIYIMLMFQQLWSVIHLTISLHKARYLYGLFFAVGALGASLGSIVPGFFAQRLGSESLVLMTGPLYLLLGACYYFALKNTKEGIGLKLNEEKGESSLGAFVHGFKLISTSRYLALILTIVVLMQCASTLIDFQFNAFLEKAISQKDLRTEYTGRILGIVHIVTLFLQLIGSFLFIRYLGVKRGHLFIPLFLGLNVIAFQLFPLFGIVSLAYVSVKSCDFSLFTILKELLYIPLTPDEKFRAKSVIDVFAHRSAKALVSTLILGLQAFLGVTYLPWLTWSCMALFASWAVLVFFFLKESKVADETPRMLETDASG